MPARKTARRRKTACSEQLQLTTMKRRGRDPRIQRSQYWRRLICCQVQVNFPGPHCSPGQPFLQHPWGWPLWTPRRRPQRAPPLCPGHLVHAKDWQGDVTGAQSSSPLFPTTLRANCKPGQSGGGREGDAEPMEALRDFSSAAGRHKLLLPVWVQRGSTLKSLRASVPSASPPLCLSSWEVPPLSWSRPRQGPLPPSLPPPEILCTGLLHY